MSFSALHSQEFLIPFVFSQGASSVCWGLFQPLQSVYLTKWVAGLGWRHPARIQKSGTCFLSPSLSWKSLVQEHCHWSIGKAAATGASLGQERAFAPLGSTLQSSAKIASVSHQPRVPCLEPSRELRWYSDWQQLSEPVTF